ncbi:hypothetical protein SPRG_19821 [Saprolegnia parasitica CBS 223.65]|uniref:Uncharacterized protein n=1 Tax=Saprolegnia parasitica (strain CBS 223.65) TaxID=695850 RepID=A0A067CUT0_SAPPC|nr:hypothetical protein SPRG_19821 [Saprolegnia parasitica CBS 223.65]KDO30271.1 hypothetical protein SPRG_19821 [Saprolegnia parasitica CBS 223.65]|eukprot:XP_012199071.1 hypothetical protein SPRG_19821 [Saprolegnia parasitica CBS 223.65]
MTSPLKYRVCVVEGCDRYAKLHGTCLAHVRSKSTHATAMSEPRIVLPSFASLMTAPIIRRTVLASPLYAAPKKRPVCVRLKNRNRQCAGEGCLAYARRGGYCTKHGGGRKCTIQGCSTTAQAYGICRLHGGGARCKAHGCHQFARSHGVCGQHGALALDESATDAMLATTDEDDDDDDMGVRLKA